MGTQPNELMSVDAELCAPAATVQLVRFLAQGPHDNVMQQRESYWLDQCLTPRPDNARACYRERWNPRRFEPLGHVFLVPPGEIMQARTDGGSAQLSIICHLHPQALSRLFDGDLRFTDPQLRACLDIHNTHIRTLLLRLAQEIRQPGLASAALVELIAAQLAIELTRYCTQITDRSTGGLSAWRLRKIDERLKECPESVTLSELAALCGLSVRQLTRGFQISRGCSIGEYISSLRLDHAKRLLATDQSVKAIAQVLGFASPSSFCCAFRRAMLQTPKQFRHGIQHKAA